MNNYELHVATHTCHDDCQNPVCVAVRKAVAAKREWQGLTDEEIFAVENSVPDAVITDRDWCVHFARAIEVKLKEKNT